VSAPATQVSLAELLGITSKDKGSNKSSHSSKKGAASTNDTGTPKQGATNHVQVVVNCQGLANIMTKISLNSLYNFPKSCAKTHITGEQSKE
jgi:hypothetical protein